MATDADPVVIFIKMDVQELRILRMGGAQTNYHAGIIRGEDLIGLGSPYPIQFGDVAFGRPADDEVSKNGTEFSLGLGGTSGFGAEMFQGSVTVRFPGAEQTPIRWQR